MSSQKQNDKKTQVTGNGTPLSDEELRNYLREKVAKGLKDAETPYGDVDLKRYLTEQRTQEAPKDDVLKEAAARKAIRDEQRKEKEKEEKARIRDKQHAAMFGRGP